MKKIGILMVAVLLVGVAPSFAKGNATQSKKSQKVTMQTKQESTFQKCVNKCKEVVDFCLEGLGTCGYGTGFPPEHPQQYTAQQTGTGTLEPAFKSQHMQEAISRKYSGSMKKTDLAERAAKKVREDMKNKKRVVPNRKSSHKKRR